MVKGVNRSQKNHPATRNKSKADAGLISGSKKIDNKSKTFIPKHTISGSSLKNRVTLGSKTLDAKKIQLTYNKVVK